MATVTKPIALDESLNTTELSSRNVADVLAQELSAVATAIGGISAPSAEDVSYDNSGSGLSAGNVQDAIDEVKGDIPTVNNGTLTIQQNGTSKGTFTANSASNVNVNIETPTADKKTATDQFTTADGGLLSKCVIDLTPVQAGSGDPSPDNVRAISGHTEVDLRVDGENLCTIESGAISTITGEDTPDSNVKRTQGMISVVPNGNYVISGFTSGSATIRIFKYDLYGSFISSYTISAVDYIITLTIPNDAYNIRFQGASSIFTNDVQMRISNLYQVQIGSTVYGGYVDLVSGVMTITHAIVDMGSLSWTYYSDRKYFDTGIEGMKLSTSESDLNDTICEGYKFGGFSYDSSLGNKPNGTYWVKNSNHVRFKDSRFTDATNFTNAVNGMELCYELATPQTIQLTPQQIETLSGQNNLSCPLSGQSIETNGVEYKELFTFADVKSYVDKKIPDAPTTDGTYTLTATVSSGVATYSWT